MGFKLNQIDTCFLTHCHFDHIGGAHQIKERTKSKLLAHEADARSIELLDELSLINMARERGCVFSAPKLDEIVIGNEFIEIGDMGFKIIHTPGHTPGCISLIIEERDGKNQYLQEI